MEMNEIGIVILALLISFIAFAIIKKAIKLLIFLVIFSGVIYLLYDYFGMQGI